MRRFSRLADLMKAAVLHGPRDLRVAPAPDPRVGADEVLVRVDAAGLCGTDYSIWTGDRAVAYPRVMGHEFLGTVAAVAPGLARVRVGERVVVEPNFSCGRCPLCREGNRNLCLQRTAVGIDADGGFAELACVPVQCVWPIPVDLETEDALLAEPLAVVVRAAKRAEPRAGETAAVLGAGTLGLLALQVLRARGARVLVVSRTGRRFELARALGAEATHEAGQGAADAAARAFSGREGVDLVIETAGTAEAVSQALALVRPGGRVVLTGLPHESTPVSFFTVVRREITISGSMIYQDEFPEAVRLLAQGLVKGRPLITHRFSLDAIDDAFGAHRDPASIKVAILGQGPA
jgi:2-desacetyl-2-hydroxyethyl bacteriochlorophyllide A dehydrogenase